MQEVYGAQGLAVVAIDLDRHREDAERFLAKFRPNFPVRFDPQGEMAQLFKIRGMPTGLIIDRRGVVRFTHTGFRPVDRSTYEDQLRAVLGEK